jgi:hypothetical protein
MDTGKINPAEVLIDVEISEHIQAISMRYCCIS